MSTGRVARREHKRESRAPQGTPTHDAVDDKERGWERVGQVREVGGGGRGGTPAKCNRVGPFPAWTCPQQWGGALALVGGVGAAARPPPRQGTAAPAGRARAHCRRSSHSGGAPQRPAGARASGLGPHVRPPLTADGAGTPPRGIQYSQYGFVCAQVRVGGAASGTVPRKQKEAALAPPEGRFSMTEETAGEERTGWGGGGGGVSHHTPGVAVAVGWTRRRRRAHPWALTAVGRGHPAGRHHRAGRRCQTASGGAPSSGTPPPVLPFASLWNPDS